MVVQTLTIGRQEFILLPKKEFQNLAAQAERQIENDFLDQGSIGGRSKSPDWRREAYPL